MLSAVLGLQVGGLAAYARRSLELRPETAHAHGFGAGELPTGAPKTSLDPVSHAFELQRMLFPMVFPSFSVPNRCFAQLSRRPGALGLGEPKPRLGLETVAPHGTGALRLPVAALRLPGAHRSLPRRRRPVALVRPLE